MKLNLLFLIVCGVLIVGCTPDLSFSSPQPEGEQDLAKFKRSFRGYYLCVSDSSVLTISKNSIVQNWYFEVEVDSIKGNKKVVDDIKVTSENNDLVIKGADSSHVVVDYTKEIFSFKKDEILRYNEGIYYLNSKSGNGSWQVHVLHFDDEGLLMLTELELGENDLEAIKKITAVNEETDVDGKVIEYRIQPTEKELSQIIGSGMFEIGEKFVRIKN